MKSKEVAAESFAVESDFFSTWESVDGLRVVAECEATRTAAADDSSRSEDRR